MNNNPKGQKANRAQPNSRTATIIVKADQNNQQGQSRNARRRQRQRANQNALAPRNNSIAQVRSVPVTTGWTLPPSSFDISRGPKPDSIRVRGRDYLGLVKTGNAVGVATLLRLDYLSPGSFSFTGTRLQKFATLYEKYIFRRARIVYIPQVATSAAGTIGMAFDKDFGDKTPPENEDGLRQYLGYQNACTFPAWGPGEIDVKLTDMQDFYYCNDTGYDGRLVYQGQLYFFAVGSLVTNTNYGQVYIEYELDYFDPQIENPLDYGVLNGTGVAQTAQAKAGWNGLANPVAAIGKIFIDDNGNQGYELPPGTYVVEQMWTAASAVAALLQPVFSNIGTIGTAVAANLLVSAASTGGFTRVDKVTISGGPVRLFGQMTATATLTNALIRIVRSTNASAY